MGNSEEGFFSSKATRVTYDKPQQRAEDEDPSLVPPSRPNFTTPPANDYSPAPEDLSDSAWHDSSIGTPDSSNVFDAPLPVDEVSAPGNFIFAVGRSGSGKSTLQSHLLNYLYTADDFTIEEDREHLQNEQAYAEFQELLLKWHRQWVEKKFPGRTEIGRPSAYRFVVRPTRKRLPALRFGFLEIAGEDFRVLIESGSEPPRLLPKLDSLLADPENKIIFVFICQGTNMKEDDMLFSSFMRYVNVRHPAVLQRSYAVLVLANPAACQKRLQLVQGVAPTGGKLDVREFVKNCTPQTLSRFKDWGPRSAIIPFSVGTLREEQGPRGPEKIISEVSFEHARRLFTWLYERFTGKSLAPSLPQRILRALNGLGGG